MLITLVVLFISHIYSLFLPASSKRLSLVLLALLVCSYGVFSSSSAFFLYFFYEASLIPILYIIVKWGTYPERSTRAIILMVFTAIFTFPFILVLFSLFNTNARFNFVLSSLYSYSFLPLDSVFLLLTFLTFSVKLPVYGLHFWLPIAHVEAPTFGSMILAGILLKLGGAGLARMSLLVWFPDLCRFTLRYLIVSLLVVTLICSTQRDFKRLVAYSSVSHIMLIPILVLANNLLSFQSALLVMFFHGLSSPILFMLVGLLYSIFGSRQLILIRGLLLFSPLLRMVLVLAFFFTLSAPPFPSFVSEVFFIASSFFLRKLFIAIFIFLAFFSLVYNLNWLVALLFSSLSLSHFSSHISFISLYPLALSFLFTFSSFFYLTLA